MWILHLYFWMCSATINHLKREETPANDLIAGRHNVKNREKRHNAKNTLAKKKRNFKKNHQRSLKKDNFFSSWYLFINVSSMKFTVQLVLLVTLFCFGVHGIPTTEPSKLDSSKKSGECNSNSSHITNHLLQHLAILGAFFCWQLSLWRADKSPA